MVSPDDFIGLLPDKPLSPEQLERLENVSGIELAEGIAGGSEGEHAIVVGGDDWAIGIAYTNQWELVDTISGESTRDRVVELMNKTSTYRGRSIE